MATEELKKAEASSALQERDMQVTTSQPSVDLADSLKALDKFGGFQLFKGLVRGLDNMDPKRKASKNIFLSEYFTYCFEYVVSAVVTVVVVYLLKIIDV